MKKFSKAMLRELKNVNNIVVTAEKSSNKRANVELRKFGVLVGDNDD